MLIPRFSNTASQAEIINALEETGCAIIECLVPDRLLDRINTELDPYFDTWGFGSGTFMPTKAKKMNRLAVKSASSHELIAHSFILGLVEECLREESLTVTVHFTEANRIYPGQTAQPLHRDDVVYPFKHPSPPIQFGTIWAADEFTEANGATCVIPRSHLWDDERMPSREDEYLYAEMPKGSVFIYNSAIYHGTGENRTKDQIRPAIIVNYGVGWLRACENPTLAVPPELARTMSKKMQDLFGYRADGYLGHFEFQSPAVVLNEDFNNSSALVNLLDEFKGQSVRRR